MNAVRTRLQFTRNEDGFTLLELVAIVFILLVVTAIVVPQVLRAQADADASRLKTKVLENVMKVQDVVADGGTAEDAYGDLTRTEEIAVVTYSYLDRGFIVCAYFTGSETTVGTAYSSETQETYTDECLRFDILDANRQMMGLPPVGNSEKSDVL